MPPPPAFDPRRKLAQLCRRHGLSEESGARWLHLLQRAAREGAEHRERLIEHVDRELSRLAEERSRARRAAAIRNDACLRAVAPLLHRWLPERGDGGLELPE